MHEARHRPTRRNPRQVHAAGRAACLSPRTSGLMKRELRNLLAAARTRGWAISRTSSGHHRLLHPLTGAIVIAAATPSCARATRNLLADLRQAERITMQETP